MLGRGVGLLSQGRYRVGDLKAAAPGLGFGIAVLAADLAAKDLCRTGDAAQARLALRRVDRKALAAFEKRFVLISH